MLQTIKKIYESKRSRDSLVRKVNRLRAGRPGNESKVHSSPKAQTALEPTQPSVLWLNRPEPRITVAGMTK
jgi:hypothetical protein